MRTENSNEPSASGAEPKADRGGATSDDRAKDADFSSGDKAPASKDGPAASTKKSGVASDDKAKGFGAADKPKA